MLIINTGLTKTTEATHCSNVNCQQYYCLLNAELSEFTVQSFLHQKGFQKSVIFCNINSLAK